jgi:NAD(P)-dependent dehydrogenase (short-subunit alcohol dehydrogenase family)
LIESELMNIVITGASRGIGAELVRYFQHQEGHTIIGIARSRDSLVALREEGHRNRLPSTFYGILYDFVESQDLKGLANQIENLVPHIDILINNAGVLLNKPFMEVDTTDFDKVFAVNVKAPFLLIQALVPRMRKGSHIVNISSMGGVQGSEKYNGLSVYSASKGAVAVLTECFATELMPLGIAVNCIAPGAVQTQMLNEAFPGYKAPIDAQIAAAFIADFSLNANKVMNGKIIPMSFSNP